MGLQQGLSAFAIAVGAPRLPASFAWGCEGDTGGGVLERPEGGENYPEEDSGRDVTLCGGTQKRPKGPAVLDPPVPDIIREAPSIGRVLVQCELPSTGDSHCNLRPCYQVSEWEERLCFDRVGG